MVKNIPGGGKWSNMISLVKSTQNVRKWSKMANGQNGENGQKWSKLVKWIENGLNT